MAKLTENEVAEALAGLPGWSYDGERIRKEFEFKGFKSAVAFIVRIAFEAEAAGHHPDLENHYNKVIVGLRTWDEDGVTAKDIALAKAIERAAGRG